MKRKSPILTYNEQRKLASKDLTATDIRIGRFYSNLEEYQKKRFDRLAFALARKYGIAINQSPMEMILIRQVALNTVRIEEAELFLTHNPEQKWSSDTEKWLLLAQKERREAIQLLSTMVQAGSKKDKLVTFDSVRNLLRKEEGLEETKTNVQKTGYQRRFYDKPSTETVE